MLHISSNAQARRTCFIASDPAPDLDFILDAARWAPSGANMQPWTFEVIDPEHVCVRLRFTDITNPYEYNRGHSVFLSGGGLIENMRIAAAWRGHNTVIESANDEPSGEYAIRLAFPADASVASSPLIEAIGERSVNRYSYQTKKIDAETRVSLQAAVGEEFRINWYGDFSERYKIARLNQVASIIKLSVPEAFPIHQKMIDFTNPFSPERVPVQSIGIDLVTQKIMRFVSANFARHDFVNRYLGGTVLPTLEMDLLPGILCGAHFTLSPMRPLAANENNEARLLRAGAAFQRLWLTATRVGIEMQPGMVPLAIATKVSQGIAFTTNNAMLQKGQRLFEMSKNAWREPLSDILIQGRIGYPMPWARERSRSLRKNISELLYEA